MFSAYSSCVTSVERPWEVPDGAGHGSGDCCSRSVSDSSSVSASEGEGSLQEYKHVKLQVCLT